MTAVLICAAEPCERVRLANTFRDLAARLSDDEWAIASAAGLGDADQRLRNASLVDLVCCDVSEDGALDWLQRLRAAYPEALLMLVADRHMSPALYLRPQILASSLLLKPYEESQLRQVVEEIISCCLLRARDEDKSLVVRTEQGRVVLPYGQIYYLEAREKRVFARLLHEEYAFYDTLGRLGEALPDYFIRTHRSYVVNSRMIERIQLSDALVTLRGGFQIPLSRSCRANLKEFGK